MATTTREMILKIWKKYDLVYLYAYYSTLRARLHGCMGSQSKRLLFEKDFLLIYHITTRFATNGDEKDLFLIYFVANATTVSELVQIIQYQF